MTARTRWATLAAALTASALFLLGSPALARDPLKPGEVFPNFTGKDLDGNLVDTKSFAKKVLLVDFWSVYCVSCVAEMPHIAALYTKYKDQGFQAIGIDLDPMMPAAKVKKFLASQDFPMPYPNIQDNKREIMTLLGVSILPTNIIVDRSGKVHLFHVGYKPGFEKELEEIVKKLLAEK